MRVTPCARRLAGAALAVAVGAGLVSCSDSGSSGDSSPVTRESMDGTADDVPAEAALTELSIEEFYPSVMAAMREAGSFSFETVSETAGRTQTMSGRARFSDAGMEMTASSSGPRAMELILLGTTMYMRSAQLGTGDSWLEVDLGDPDSPFGAIGRVIDPQVMLTALRSPEALELLGTEDVDGAATHHYRITVDPTRFLEAMHVPSAMVGMLPEVLVTEMWVDADHLPRRFAQSVAATPDAGGTGTSTTTEGTYSDFGIDVEVVAPPADEVTGSFPGD